MEPLADAAREAAGVELKLHTRSKSEDGGAQARTLLDAAAAAADAVVLGTLAKVACMTLYTLVNVALLLDCRGHFLLLYGISLCRCAARTLLNGTDVTVIYIDPVSG